MIDPKTLTGNWNYPTTIWFGPGRIKQLPRACRRLAISRPLLVTDPGLAKLPMIEQALAQNRAEGLATGLFSEVRANPVGANVAAGVAAYRAGGYDGVIAFGGGSSLDAGKAIALMVGQDRPIWDFEDVGDNFKRVRTEAMAPVVAVPTTAGTGSETGRAAVIVDEDAKVKRILFHPNMMPGVVIDDPELTLGLPAKVTAAVGMDALAHAFEAYCAPAFHPLADGIAVEAMRLIHDWLPVAVMDGGNLAARAHMMAAASMGSTAFQKGLGAIHSLSHPIGAIFDSHHGLTNAVVMPYVMRFNRPAIEDKMVRLARWLHLPEASYQGVLDWILRLRAEIGIPHELTALGVGPGDIATLAAMAEADPSTGTNPRPAKAADMARMLTWALAGEVGA